MASEGPKRVKNLFAVAPQLLVEDVVATAEYYRDVLGFEIGPYARHRDGEPPFFAMVTRDGLLVQLRLAPAGGGPSNRGYETDACDVYFFVKDIGALFDDLRNRGAKILLTPQDKRYQMREIEIEDCNGRVIAFGEPIPSAGEGTSQASS